MKVLVQSSSTRKALISIGRSRVCCCRPGGFRLIVFSQQRETRAAKRAETERKENICQVHLLVHAPLALQSHIGGGATVKALPVEEESHFLWRTFYFLRVLQRPQVQQMNVARQRGAERQEGAEFGQLSVTEPRPSCLQAAAGRDWLSACCRWRPDRGRGYRPAAAAGPESPPAHLLP